MRHERSYTRLFSFTKLFFAHGMGLKIMEFGVILH